MQITKIVGVSSSVAARFLKGGSFAPLCHWSMADILKHGLPRPGLPREVLRWRMRNLPHLWRGFWRLAAAKLLRLPVHFGALSIVVLRDGAPIEYGLASLRLVTTTGVGFIVDAFQNSVEVENMKFHGYGTGTNAENASNTALQTELTTEYATNNTRPTGTTTEGASANIYRTVATLSPDSNVAITEHGIFDQASNAGGVLLDRSVFSAVNLVASTDSLQTTYELTFATGS